MDLYKISVKITPEGYFEDITRIDSIEERETDYFGNAFRIDKEEVGLLKKGSTEGTYEAYLDEPELLYNARINILQTILIEKADKLKEMKKMVDILSNYSLKTPVSIRKIKKGDDFSAERN